ncbi:DMT family transporter [Photobacterium piscicola]|uniref:DMT family transporter n=1 Tax=Photobacterium piscicola TaxID=1378299 RepID=UPI002E185857|nr:DMT family transporter [Photobacterium piscicola]
MKYYLSIQITAILFGLSAVIGEQLNVSVMTIVFGRSLLAVLTLIILLKLDHQSFFPTATKSAIFKLILNGSLLAIHWFCFFMGVKKGGVAVGTLGFACFPLFIILIESVFMGKKIGPIDILICILIAIGLIIITPHFSFDINNLGLVWGILAAITNALFIIFNRSISLKIHPLQSAFAQCIGCLLLSLPFGMTGMFTLQPIDMLLMVILGVFSTAIAQTLLVFSLQGLKAKTVSMIITLEPVYAIMFVWILFAEKPTVTTLFGILFIITAAIFASLKKYR